MAQVERPGRELSADRARWLRRRLRRWYRCEGRDLPWRRSGDPWAVLVSEAMLQQTQAARVAARFDEFLERFPTPAAMAQAPVGSVVAAWQGLGYNRRAVSLHRAATAIVEHHAGVVPADLDALQRLPGVGPYTARAVRAFAFDRPAAPVDTNVARVLARLVAGAPLSRPTAQRMADALTPRYAPGEWGQALMELGAGICTARRPDCAACPVAAGCAWQGRGPDPAAAGGHRPRPQGPLKGSDRWHRARLVDALRQGPVPVRCLGVAARLDDEARLQRLVAGLVDDGLAVRDDGHLRLPG